MVAGTPPIRAKKARYYEDRRFQERIISPPNLVKPATARPDDWSTLPLPATPAVAMPTNGGGSEDEDTTDSERRHQPELSRAKPVEPNKARNSTRLNSSHQCATRMQSTATTKKNLTKH